MSEGPDLPNYVDPAGVPPDFATRGKCLVQTGGAKFTCDGTAKFARRLCPCK